MIYLGKYTFDVLLAYGISLALLVGLIWVSWSASKRTKAKLSAQESKQDG